MTLDLTQYLESIRFDARLEDSDETGVMSELEAHIEDKLQELTDSGLNKEEAVRTCLNQMGSTKSIARQIYEAHSQGSWKQVLLASMPHFLFGLLFVLNWWHYPGWLSLVLVLILATTVYGWCHGKPTWVFPWLGYTLLPGVIGSLMLLPMPIIIGWLLAISPSGRFSEESLERLYYYAPWIGLSFMGMALTIAVFIRLRQRWLRVSLLAASSLFTLSLIVYHSTGNLINLAFLGLLIIMWGVLLVPPILESRLKHRRAMSYRNKNTSSTGFMPTS